MQTRKIIFFAFIFLVINNIYSQKEIIYLSGRDNENTVEWDFYCTGGRNSGYWTKIKVPSHWEQQGFGDYDYGRAYHTYGKKYKYADEQGLYKYKFTVPQNWKSKEIYIVFEGVMTDAEVKINGQSAGPIHQGAFYRFKYNISDKLNFGKENLLELTVSKMSSNKSVNNAERYADYWIFGGIFRPVYLEAFPKEYIERVAINAKADGYFAIDIFPKNLKSMRNIEVKIIDASKKVVTSFRGIANKNDSLITLTSKVTNPELWTPETPILYTVNITLYDKSVKLYSLSEKFGFRTIEIRKGDGIYINNTKVKMKGINRHVFWPESGRCINPRIDLMDVMLMKELNLNAVRCSHYPPDITFLEYCDSIGLFVIDELAGWQQAYDTEVGAKLVREMVIRDVNHPSIIFWSNGNEGGTNKQLDDDFGIYDPSNRPVIHPHHKPGNDFNGIDCNHYEDYYSSKNILQGPNIYMPTEFLHGQDDGGMAAGLSDFWELFWSSNLSGGGFLWAMLDEGIVRTDLNNYIDVDRVNAPDGILGPYRQKEGSFYAMREIFSPVKIFLNELPQDFDGQIEIENRYYFTNLKKCKFQWQLVNFYSPANRRTGHQVIKEGYTDSPDIAPVSKGNLKINLPDEWKNFDALFIKVFDPYGREIITKTYKINHSAIVDKIVKLTWGDVSVNEDDKKLRLKANGITVIFNKTDGTIDSLRNEYSPTLLFRNGPVLVSGNAKPVSSRHYRDDDAYIFEVNYEGDLKYLRWKMFTSGWLSLEYEYQVTGPQQFLGITFDYPESNIIGVKWLGNGPYRVWKNRLSGVSLDVHQKFYNNTQTGSLPWIYPEFKGYYSDITWIEFNMVEGKFLVVAKEKNLFVRLFDFASLSGPEIHPPLPKGNISFLDGIPPTGTKLATNIETRTSKLGPQSELNRMDTPIKRTLYFYFGLPE
jgi:beta-galactosidase/beta-glucuronidase